MIPFDEAVLPELELLERCAASVPRIEQRWRDCIWPNFVVLTAEDTMQNTAPWNSSYEFTAGASPLDVLVQHHGGTRVWWHTAVEQLHGTTLPSS